MVQDASKSNGADCWVVNSCTVKSPSQSQMATVISDARARGIPVVVAGCVPQGDKKSRDLQVHNVLAVAWADMDSCHTKLCARFLL